MKIVKIIKGGIPEEDKYSIRRWNWLWLPKCCWEYYDPVGLWWSPAGHYGEKYLKDCLYSLEKAKELLDRLRNKNKDTNIWKKGGYKVE